MANVGAEVARLNALLGRWRESGLAAVRSVDVVPDATNREGMGLSLEHTHYIAQRIAEEGFTPREGVRGHDIPVLVRESADSELGSLSLARWRARVREVAGFPPVEVTETLFFTSLGNGHFSQALNCFRCNMRSILTGRRFEVGEHAALRAALRDGVPSIVLRSNTPRADRKAISLLLNKLHHVKWDIGDDGELHLLRQQDADGNRLAEAPSQFEALSKVLDADELSALVRTKLGIDVEEAQSGYKERLGGQRSKL
eukprot:jgi/Tetstr1/454951/TSEL_041812.t1